MSTWYLDAGSGNDTTGSGTSGSPWLTISKAHTSASSGDTIICKTSASTYTWASQTFTKNLTIQGESVPVYNPATKAWTGAIFDGAAAVVKWWQGGGAPTLTIVINNLIFQNAIQNASTTTAASYFANFLSLTMNRCVFQTLEMDRGASFRYGGLIDSQEGYAIAATLNSCVVRGNTFTQTFGGCLGAFTMYSLQTYTLYNNIIYGGPAIFDGQGATLSGYVVVAKNNILHTVAWVRAVAPATVTYNNNDAYNCTSIPSGSNNLTSDPLFVDPANGDFRLRPSSPAVNSGVAL